MSNMIFGYARVSTDDQTHALQLDALNKFGCDEIFKDQISGSIRKRPGLDEMISKLRKGDCVVVWKLDRLGRSLKDFLLITEQINDAGADLICVQDKVDTTTPSGKLMFHLLAILAEFERDMLIERTKAGIESAKKRGVHMGRPSKTDKAAEHMILTLYYSPHHDNKAIMERFGISKSTLYRIVRSNPDFEPNVQTDLLEYCS